MKHYMLYKRTLLALFMIIVLSSFGQQQLTHVATKENISCNYDCTILDVAELNNNGAAVIFVIPVSEKGGTINQHPIGAYYFKEKWHIFNMDSRPIPVGSKFTVTYFTNPDEKHFLYSFRKEDIQADGSALIDHPSLNNNPGAKFSSFPRWDPNSQGGITNRDEIKTEYNAAAGKWSFSNKNQKPLFSRVTYNISLEGSGIVNPQITPPRTSMQIPELLATQNTNAVYGDIVFMWMSVWADGVKLPGDNKINTNLEETELYKLEMGANNLLGRKNSYDPITIQFHSGCPMFIPLLNAFINKQNMVFSITAWSHNTIGTSSTGKAALNYTLKLSGASIISYKQVFDPAEENDKAKVIISRNGYDEIKIKFANIEYINSAGETATDNQ